MNLFGKLVARLSNQPGLFLFFRRLIERDFIAIRALIRSEMCARDSTRTLDLGCGPGAFSTLFPAQSYYGVDINSRYIDYARRRYRGHFLVGDARRLDLPNDRFDQVLIFGVLHHVDDETLRAILAECHRVLVKDGLLLVVEDIPVISRLNLLGRVIHQAENGRYIRSPDEYRRLFSEVFAISKEHILASGLCDYYAAVLRR